MEFTVDTRPIAKLEADALVTYAFDQEKPTEGILAQLDQATGGALSKLAAAGEFTGKMLEVTLLYYPAGLAAQRLLILGAGQENQIRHRRIAQDCRDRGARTKARQVKSIAFLAREDDRSAAAAQAIAKA